LRSPWWYRTIPICWSPIKIEREQLGIRNPQKNPSPALLPHIDFIKQIRGGVLGASQLARGSVTSQGSSIVPCADSERPKAMKPAVDQQQRGRIQCRLQLNRRLQERGAHFWSTI
jgi:hypothetical protein